MSKEKHNHSHSHNHGHHHHASGNIVVAFWLNFFFCIVEIVGGILTNSVAILSDALHDLGDSFSLALAWYFQKISKRKRDVKFSYGYRRFSLLGAIINSVVLLFGSFFVISESVQRLQSPEQPNAQGMLYLAILGIAINGAALLRLKKGHSLNERAVALHLLEDVLGWVAVLIGSIVMMFVDIPILDPIMSIAIAVFILFNIYKNLKDTLRVVLQGTPDNVDPHEIEHTLLDLDGVQSIHDLHLWTMDGEYNIMTVHVVHEIHSGKISPAGLKQKIREELSLHNVHHATIEIEASNESCGLENGCCE